VAASLREAAAESKDLYEHSTGPTTAVR